MTAALLEAPSATDSPEALADWLEMRALCAGDGNSSIEDLVRVIRRSTSTEGLADGADHDPGSEKSQAVAQDAFAEVEDRRKACGGEAGFYPFDVGGSYIQLREGYKGSAYVFQLILTHSGPMLGVRKKREARAEVIFEDICTEAAQSYFGGKDSGGRALAMGFPRKTHTTFPGAVTVMCAEMGEGGGCCEIRPGARPADAKLDIVAWRDFSDRRAGKLMGFGQCAAGKDWKEKLSELDEEAFRKKWLREQPAVNPVRLFFVPRRIGRPEWRETAIEGGVLFDRCRIAHHAGGLPEGLAARVAWWTEKAIEEALCQ
jgi:hypothetical protein